MPSELVAEPVIGYRVWEIDSTRPTALFPEDIRLLQQAWDEGESNPLKGMSAPWLGGVGVDAVWTRPTMTATCKAHANHSDPPEATCECGIWALKDEADLEAVLRKYRRAKCAWGTVQLWGSIVETEFGYRGQYAQPLAITAFGISEEEAAEMAEAYECELTVTDRLPIGAVADEATSAAQQFSQQLQILSKTMGAAITPALVKAAGQAAAAAQAMAASPLTTQQTVAALKAVQALGYLPTPQPTKRQRFFGALRAFLKGFLSGWFFLTLAIMNLAFWIADGSWVSLLGGVTCGFYAIYMFRGRIRRYGRFIIFFPALAFCLLLYWVPAMAVALILDSLVFKDSGQASGPYGVGGRAENWVWEHDPCDKLERLCGLR